MATIDQSKAKTDQVFEVTAQDLPVCCPLPQHSRWNMHPRVFLHFDENNEAVCPYCGAKYVLTGDTALAHSH